MSQPGQDHAQDLEQAIMARARELAQEFHDKAARQRDNILRDAAERLQLAEEHEILVAKADAERHFRRVTQASELKMQGRLDQLRWAMVQTVEARLSERMQALRDDRDAYRAWLVAMVREAHERLPAGELTAEAISEDHGWLAAAWPAIVAEAAPQRAIRLADKPTWGSGGAKLRTHDNKAQIDNRFEGRLERLETQVQRVILQQLFPTDINASARNGGPQ